MSQKLIFITEERNKYPKLGNQEACQPRKPNSNQSNINTKIVKKYS